jgi:hypothetical protein
MKGLRILKFDNDFVTQVSNGFVTASTFCEFCEVTETLLLKILNVWQRIGKKTYSKFYFFRE